MTLEEIKTRLITDRDDSVKGFNSRLTTQEDRMFFEGQRRAYEHCLALLDQLEDER